MVVIVFQKNRNGKVPHNRPPSFIYYILLAFNGPAYIRARIYELLEGLRVHTLDALFGFRAFEKLFRWPDDDSLLMDFAPRIPRVCDGLADRLVTWRLIR